jgi:spore maturation protein CgeB
MTRPRLHVTQRLRALLSYRKFAGPTPRILILRGDYWLDDACARAAHAMGWEVHAVPIAAEGHLPREAVAGFLKALAFFRPDFVLSINLAGMDDQGLFARLFEDLEIPYAVWFADNPRTITMGSDAYSSSYSVAFTWDRSYRPYLSSIGFPAVHYLPLAVDPALFDAAAHESWSLPPTFVGNSNTASSIAERSWLRVHDPGLVEVLDFALDAGQVSRDRFAEGLAAMIDPALHATLGSHDRRHGELYLFCEATRRARRALVEKLLPEGLVVHGDAGWRSILESARGPVPYGPELMRHYGACEINLNNTSCQMPMAVNQRVFDCPASGGFLLTDAQEAVAELFEPEREAVCYHSFDECADKLRFYRRTPEARLAVVRKAQKRIMSEHTYAHRLRSITELVRNQFGS